MPELLGLNAAAEAMLKHGLPGLAQIAKRNVRVLAGRNEYSNERAYIDLEFAQQVTGKVLTGSTNIPVCKAAIALARIGVDLSERVLV